MVVRDADRTFGCLHLEFFDVPTDPERCVRCILRDDRDAAEPPGHLRTGPSQEFPWKASATGRAEHVLAGLLHPATRAEQADLLRPGQSPQPTSCASSVGRATSILAGPMPLLDLSPATLDEYIAGGGLLGLEKALASSAEAVIDAVTRSGLRGRGGGAFPTGAKWQTVRTTGSGTRYAVCNAAEGEPATYKDRLLLLRNPYQVLEGLLIGAWAVGAKAAIIGLKETFTDEAQRVGRAIEEMGEIQRLAGVSLEMALGPDHYLLGEETGLLEVIENRPPLPRSARPFMLGLFGTASMENPTLVNNVETLANVPPIVTNGPEWLRANGPESSPGTMLFTICGDIRREGVFELPMGTPLRHLVEELGGGSADGRTVKAIVPGASNTVILPEQLDTPLDFDSMREAGTGLGSGGFAVFDDSACMVRVAHMYSRFLWVESCGQCPPCKFGCAEVTSHLARLD